MAAAAAAGSSTTATTPAAGQDEAVVKTTKSLPRAIQLIMTTSSLLEPSATASMKTIGEHGVDRFFALLKLVFLLSMIIGQAALLIYGALRDDDGKVMTVISGGAGFVFLAVLALPSVYLAVVAAAGGHLDLFAPQTPYAAWETVFKVGAKAMGLPVMLISLGTSVLYSLMLDKAWLLLVACFCLLGLLVASTVALWLCLLRTYGGGGGERREKNSSCGEAVIDGLAYLYSRLLYEFAVRFLAVADAGMQQLDTESSSLV